MSTLEKQIQDIEGRIAKTEALLQQNAEEVTSIECRAEKAKKRIIEIAGEIEAETRVRRKALASGEAPPKDIIKRRHILQEERELREDEAAGLETRLSEVKAEREVLRGQHATLKDEIPKVKMRDAGRRYNDLAAQLAPVVKELWTLMVEMNDTTDGRVVACPGHWDGSLDCIPRLYIVGEEPVPDSSDRQRRGEFWDARRWRENIHHEMAVDKDLRARGIRK